MTSTADVVICGAGIAGIAAAYHLTVTYGVKDVVLVTEHPPLTLTSDKSTECYRNWWPGPGDAMVRLMNHSIDLLEGWARESGNRFQMNRRGYAFVTADPGRVADFQHAAEEAASLGAGPVRYHAGRPNDPPYQPIEPHDFEHQPTGSDLLLDSALILKHFPYLTENVVAMVHPRRCGWFSGQQLGMYLLEKARAAGARLLPGKVERVDVAGGRVEAVRVSAEGGPEKISTRNFVNAAGPFLGHVGKLLDVDIPVFSEFHGKIAFNDYLGVVRRDAPLIIWTDPQRLPWSDEEREALAESDETRFMLDEFPSGVHLRPEGGPGSSVLLILWTYDMAPREPVFPTRLDPYYPEILLRGMSTMIPGFAQYFGKAPKSYYDGGYYTKTRENRPLGGPLPVEGAFVCGAVSGYGLMASPAVGELVAAHVTGSRLPSYAPAFSLARYDDPEYQGLLENWGASGQL
ncbi:MAG: FAD-binding oxidoreductase [Chloroflexi bacterium]|nr:FAD-binding oxidoreductase [Chloroflexota bacterium]